MVVIGASAGGIESLTSLVSRLDPNLPASVLVVLHIPAESPSYLPQILSRSGPLPVSQPEDGEDLQPGQIYIAPPGIHMLVNDGHIQLSHGPRVNGLRPAIDPLFRSVAHFYGPRAIGVVLSGSMNDGTAGSQRIKARGGIVIAQQPTDALFPSMPLSVIENVPVDMVLPAAQIGDAVNRIANEPVQEGGPGMPDPEANASNEIKNDIKTFEENQSATPRSVLTCPACGGLLWELRDGQLVHYQCHVGHDYSPEALFEEQSERLEGVLWAALRALVEKAALSNRLALRAKSRGSESMEHIYLKQARQAEADAALLRQVLAGGKGLPPEGETSGEVANQEVTDEADDLDNQ
jgi:two-component system chemotaxis response regulator CheB